GSARGCRSSGRGCPRRAGAPPPGRGRAGRCGRYGRRSPARPGGGGSRRCHGRRRGGCEPLRTRKKSLMKTYGTPAAADPFARSRLCFESLVEDLTSGRAGEMTHDQMEELIGARGREVQRQLLQDHLDLRAIREQEALAAGRERRRGGGRGRGGPGYRFENAAQPPTRGLLEEFT